MTPPNFTNRTMWTGDNLDFMRGMNSESVDLICLGPPFNSNRNNAAPVDSLQLLCLSLVLLMSLMLASCTPNGHLSSYGWWQDSCPDFPPYKKVERVVEEREELIKELFEKRLIDKLFITPCPDGAFITFYSKNKAGVLELLDEANARTEGLTYFYGVPFRFARD